MMQKLPYWDFIYTTLFLDKIISTPDDSDHVYYITCNVEYFDICKDRTE